MESSDGKEGTTVARGWSTLNDLSVRTEIFRLYSSRPNLLCRSFLVRSYSGTSRVYFGSNRRCHRYDRNHGNRSLAGDSGLAWLGA